MFTKYITKEELLDYADNVLTRFANPYIKHYLSSIVLNSDNDFGYEFFANLETKNIKVVEEQSRKELKS